MAQKCLRSLSSWSIHLPSPTPEEIHRKFKDLNDHDNQKCKEPNVFVNDPVAQSRDRHPKIRAFANNRIRLDGLANCYINASPIALGEHQYIATQGPTEERLLWRMVWQCDISVIVMLTRLVENNVVKCFPYYPDKESDIIDAGPFQVDLLEKKQNGSTDIRKLRILHAGVQRTVWHLLFKDWPDHGVPMGTDKAALLALINLSQAKNVSGKGRVVHCSAGCGRTGTFIALDHLLQRLKEGTLDASANKDEIFLTVKRLREQRMKQVYTEGQLAFIYRILRKSRKPKESNHNEPPDLKSNSVDSIIEERRRRRRGRRIGFRIS